MKPFEEFDKHTRLLLSNVTVIMIIGIVMVYSSSYIYAKELYGSSLYFFLKQIFFSLLGMALAYTVSKTKKSLWPKYAGKIHLLATLLLLFTLIPPLGEAVKGAYRWINLFGVKFQPGEFVKITIILSAVSFFEKFERREKKENIIHALSLFAPLIIFVAQPDFGTFSICFISIAFVCYLSDFHRKIFYFSLGGGLLAAIPLLLAKPYRVERIFSFLDPWKNAKGSGFQIIQSYLAFASGAVTGQGLGNSNEKLFYLPEAHNDFIFSVIGEEAGFIGVSIVVISFAFFLHLGLNMASLLRDKYYCLLAASLSFLLAFQAFLNMGVVLGLLPTKGLNLPFISYGGSSLVANFFLVGLLLLCAKKDRPLPRPLPSTPCP